MGTIKDIVDLAIQLGRSVQDRKLAAEIFKIQKLILTVQKDDAALVSENLDLKKKIFELEKDNLALNKKSFAKGLQDKYDFIKELGIYKSKESGHFFCTSCLMKNIESPLTEKPSGWRYELKDCGEFYSNPSHHLPKRRPPSYFRGR
jgi:hypothetical protein